MCTVIKMSDNISFLAAATTVSLKRHTQIAAGEQLSMGIKYDHESFLRDGRACFRIIVYNKLTENILITEPNPAIQVEFFHLLRTVLLTEHKSKRRLLVIFMVRYLCGPICPRPVISKPG